MYFVYIIKSLKNGKYYIGQTNNIERRLKDHNRGKDHSSKIGMPWILVLKEIFESRKEAVNRERYLKSFKKRDKLEKLIYRGVEQ